VNAYCDHINLTGMVGLGMTPTSDQAAIRIRSIEIVAEQFRRTGSILPRYIHQNPGTGLYSASPRPSDCENGMLRPIRSLPANFQHSRA
jgi:hypothetical protein